MELVGVRLEVPANTPVVILQESNGRRRVLPILIGGPEAQSIHLAIEGVQPPRPLTHDLFRDVLAALDVTVEQVVITEVREHTYYAELHLRSAVGEHVISSRPSDAIALAVRVGAPIFADDALLDEVGHEEPDESEAEAEAEEQDETILDEFRDFIASVNPDDFKET
jgi:bifunctional DNase/RNase